MKHRTLITASAFLFLGLFVFSQRIAVGTEPQVAWSKSISTGNNLNYSEAMDASGNVYLCGFADASVLGSDVGVFTSYLAKYNPDGNLLWKNLSASSNAFFTGGVSVDGLGNVFVLGGNNLNKFSPSGQLLWNTPLPGGSYHVAVDANGNAYVDGKTSDCTISKISSSGSLIWTTSVATGPSSWCNSIAVDATGNAVITGVLYPNNQVSGFATKVNASGTITWNQHFSDSAYSAAFDSTGSTYLTVYAELIKYDSNNNIEWTRPLVKGGQFVASIALDPNGAVYVDPGGYDGLLKFDSSGNLLDSITWDRDSTQHLLAYGNGRLSIVGLVDPPGPLNYGTYVSNIVVPEPSTIALLGMGGIGLIGFAWRLRNSQLIHFRH